MHLLDKGVAKMMSPQYFVIVACPVKAFVDIGM